MKYLAPIFLFLVSVVLFALTLRGVYGNIDAAKIKGNYDKVTQPFELSPERGRFILTYSLAERHSFALDQKLANSADPDVGYYQGKYYIYFGPGVSFLAVPFYNLGKNYNLSQVASYAMISLFAALNVLLVYFIGLRVLKLSRSASMFAALTFGFSSTGWSYANTMYQHHITTFLILSAFFAAWGYVKGGWKSWFLAFYIWTAYGFSIFVDYPNLVLMAPVIVYFGYKSLLIQRVKDKINISFNLLFIISSIMFLFFIFLQGYYNYVHFGNWRKLSGELVSISTVKDVKKTKLNLEQSIQKAANKKSAGNFIKEENTSMSFAILTFAIDKGIFIFSPIFLLSLLGIYSVLKKISAEHSALLGVVLASLFVYSSWADPWGGWAFGPRYLIPSMSILSLYVALWFKETRFKLLSTLTALLLFIISSAIAVVGALTTNQVPPKVEADVLKIGYNFLLNYSYLMKGKNSSFIYNTYLSSYISLVDYYLIIFSSVVILGFFLLIQISLRKQNET